MKIREIGNAILDFELSNIPKYFKIVLTYIPKIFKSILTLILLLVVNIVFFTLLIYRKCFIIVVLATLFMLYESGHMDENAFNYAGVIGALVGILAVYFVARRWTQKPKEQI